ncbi:MAG: tyrosine-type recombinase/integrase [Chitinivibrionia bacterium]|nr:tyrosine-type recombinase/integrase [Chitinivibrionia bacterium]
MLETIIDRYLADCLKQGKDRKYYFRSFLLYFADKPTTWQNFCAWYMDGINNNLEKKYAAETLYTKWCLIKAAYTHSVNIGLIEEKDNPFYKRVLPPSMKQAMKRKRIDEHKPVIANHAVIENFLVFFLKRKSEETNVRLIALLAYYTGMRVNEICTLKWTDIKTNWLHLQNTKERNPRKVSLDDNALSVIAEARNISAKYEHVFPSSENPANSVSPKVIAVLIARHWRAYRKANKDADFNFSFKSLRTAYIQAAQFNGHTIEGIKKQVGHRSVYITDYSYNGSACTRSINDFSTNPKNEVIHELSKMLRTEIIQEEVIGLDLPRFLAAIKEHIRVST